VAIFKSIRSSVLTGSCLLCLSALPAAAQNAEQLQNQERPPVIVVTGEGLPPPQSSGAYAVETIDRERLTTTASGRLEDALASVAGFQQFRRSDSRSANPSAQGVTLRALGGNATSRALVLLDGVPMADPFFGFIPLSAIAPERLGSVRVTRGGGSGPFGAGALAGTIELSSAGPDQLSPAGGHIYLNNRGETESAAHLAGKLGGGFAVISGRWDRGRGFYTTPAEDRTAASARAAFDSYSVQTRATAPLMDNIELQARALIYEDHRTLRFEGADSSSTGQDASLRAIGRGAMPFDALAYVQARNFSNIVVSSSRFVPVLDQRNTPSTGLGGKFEIRPAISEDTTLRLGTDYRHSDGQLAEVSLSAFSGAVNERRAAGGRTSDLGLFAEGDMSIGKVTVTAGARLDRTSISDGFYLVRDASGRVLREEIYPDRSGWEQSFRGGVIYDLGSGIKLRAAAYSGLRLPTLNELYRPFTIFPVTTEANAKLSSERLIGFEAGFDLTPSDDIRLSLTAFDNRVEDAIANVTLGPVTRQRQNIDEISSRGIEASTDFIFGAISFNGSLSYTDAVARETGAAFDGNRPAQTPSLAGSASLRYTIGPDSTVAVTVRHIGQQFEDDLEADMLPAATTLDAYGEFALHRNLALVVRGENLTDEEVVTRNQGGSIDFGIPRTVWLGVKLTN